MKSKLVFRILGALASALIIASIFIPFVSVTGYSQSLWEANNAVGTIYLPIMIIVFGVVGVLVFSTGFKTELAYASSGGLLFFLIMQTVPVLDQNLFNTLGVGYYCLAIGTLLIIIMAFICGLRVKQKVVKENVVEDTKEVSMIDQIDKLYNDQTENQNQNETNSLDNIIQPLPIATASPIPVQNNVQIENNIVEERLIPSNETISLQNLNSVSSGVISNSEIGISELTNVTSNINVENNVITNQTNDNIPNNQEQPLNPTVSEFSESNAQILESNNAVNSVVNEFNIPTQNVTIANSIPMVSNIQEQPLNPTVSEFSQSNVQNLESNNAVNPVVNEFNIPIQNVTIADSIPTVLSIQEQPLNPTISEFSQSNVQILESNNAVNPVVNEFSNSISTNQSSFISNNSTELQINESTDNAVLSGGNGVEEIKPLGSAEKIDLMGAPANNGSNLDIFG